MKVAMSDRGKESLLREAVTLKKLSDTKVQSVPRFLAIEEDGRRTWQTVVGGRLTSRKLTMAHIDYLLQLPTSESSTTLNEQQELLRISVEKNFSLFENHRKIIDYAIAAVHGGVIPLVLVHGDFAPWNLKLQLDGKIAAIDWEEADWFGLPLWDLCHFFLIQAHLFKVNNPVRQLNNSPLIQQYLVKMGIAKKNIVALVLLYILLTVFDAKASCSEAYKKFLLSQIQSLVAI
jgi:aminoglycoside phosphotransferase (APT) family kinase protein